MAVHYTHQHPEVTFYAAAMLNAIERHLRAIVEHLGAAEVEALKPLPREWLADLVAFANAEPEPPAALS